MSDLEQILWTSSATIIGGLVLLILGELVVRFVIQPLEEQKKLIGEIADALIFFASVYSNPPLRLPGSRDTTPRMHPEDGSPWHVAGERTRQLAAQLRARTYVIPAYRALAALRLAIARPRVEEASNKLIGLSNQIIRGDGAMNYLAANEIRDLLRIPK